MIDRCRSCGRPLQDPESIAAGLGPKCRRALRGGRAQLAFDIGAPARPRRRRPRIHWPAWYRGRRVHTLADIATYQPQEARP